jgi:hypothetical protein
MGRTVTLVLVDAGATLLGALPPFDLPSPYWQEAADVVAGAREHHGVDVQVLRLLHADRDAPPGGRLTMLAQVRTTPSTALAPVQLDLRPCPHRAPWAQPGGPAASLRWAAGELGRADLDAVQQRTWNLSAIWRLDAAGTPLAWLKQVPWFFAHEAAVLQLLAGSAPGLAPRLIAAGAEGRQLLAHVPGVDCYGAGAAFRAAVAADWHPVQQHLAGRVDELLAAGVPDGRDLMDRIVEVAAPYRRMVVGLRALLAALPRRLADVAACGMPDTLVHGDLHPGNVRADGAARVIIDWGDATVAHPGYDILRLTEDLPAADAVPLVAAWARRWRAAAPGSDPQRAVALLAPVAQLRSAVAYADFLARIEPAEHPYHARDVPDRLAAAVAHAGVAAEPGIP